jgi:hypothetical protein
MFYFIKIFIVNLINHNLSGVENFYISFSFSFFWGFFEKISILEVEIGRNMLGILGVKLDKNPT